MQVLNGRFGPYVKWGKVNATLPKGKDPQSVTLEEAIPLLAERAAKSGAKPAKAKAAPKTKAAAKPKAAKAAAEKAEKPKTAAKKTTTAKAKAAPKVKKG